MQNGTTKSTHPFSDTNPRSGCEGLSKQTQTSLLAIYFSSFRGDLGAFLDKLTDIVFPVAPGSSSGPTLGPLPEGCSLNTSAERCPGGILTRYPSHLIWLFSTQRSSGSTPSFSRVTELLTLSEEEPSHPTEDAHFLLQVEKHNKIK